MSPREGLAVRRSVRSPHPIGRRHPDDGPASRGRAPRPARCPRWRRRAVRGRSGRAPHGAGRPWVPPQASARSAARQRGQAGAAARRRRASRRRHVLQGERSIRRLGPCGGGPAPGCPEEIPLAGNRPAGDAGRPIPVPAVVVDTDPGSPACGLRPDRPGRSRTSLRSARSGPPTALSIAARSGRSGGPWPRLPADEGRAVAVRSTSARSGGAGAGGAGGMPPADGSDSGRGRRWGGSGTGSDGRGVAVAIAIGGPGCDGDPDSTASGPATGGLATRNAGSGRSREVDASSNRGTFEADRPPSATPGRPVGRPDSTSGATRIRRIC